MFTSHYDQWILSRMDGIQKYMDPDYFRSRTLLEVGGGHGHIGNKFHQLGAIVTTSDARREHVDEAHKKYPHLHTLVIDGDRDPITENYDIILHWGLLYHLQEIEHHLETIAQHCTVLLLETEVSDSDDDAFFVQVNESGYDQAFHSVGIRPSPSYVEKVLDKNGFHFQRILDPILNSSFHCYDWSIQNTKTWQHGLRRFWICWKKNTDSPLKTFS